MADKLPWDRPMDPRNALHPDNTRYKPYVLNRPVARDGYPILHGIMAAVDAEWLQEVCKKAGVEFRSEWVATETNCPMTSWHGHVWYGLRPGTADSDFNVLYETPDRCQRCGFLKPSDPDAR